MATAVYFIPPVRYLLFRASAAFFRSASSRSRCEWRVAISRRLFGRRLLDGGGWGKKAGVGPCDPEYALKLELLRKKAGVDAAFFELGHLAADSADTLAASVDAKAIGDAFQT